MSGDHGETDLSQTDVHELDIIALLESPEAVAAFDSYGPLITARTAPQFANLLRMINSLADGDDFEAAVDAAMFAAVRCPVDITRLDAFGALSTTNPIVKVAAVQMLRTIHNTKTTSASAGAKSPVSDPENYR